MNLWVNLDGKPHFLKVSSEWIVLDNQPVLKQVILGEWVSKNGKAIYKKKTYHTKDGREIVGWYTRGGKRIPIFADDKGKKKDEGSNWTVDDAPMLKEALQDWGRRGDDTKLIELVHNPTPQIKKIVENHQKELKKKYGDEIKLYRGEGTPESFESQSSYEAFMDTVYERGFQSWTSDKSKAENYAYRQSEGIVLERTVSVSDIFMSHHQKGWDYAGESEFIVLL